MIFTNGSHLQQWYQCCSSRRGLIKSCIISKERIQINFIYLVWILAWPFVHFARVIFDPEMKDGLEASLATFRISWNLDMQAKNSSEWYFRINMGLLKGDWYANQLFEVEFWIWKNQWHWVSSRLIWHYYYLLINVHTITIL